MVCIDITLTLITATPLTDFDYIRTLMQRPALRRACNAGFPCDEATVEQALLDQRARYFEIRDIERRLGFVVFHMLTPLVAELHTCLLTLGQRTREAVKLAIAAICSEGAKIVVAAYPAVNRAAERMLVDVGFLDSPELAQLYPESIRATYKFKEMPCPG